MIDHLEREPEAFPKTLEHGCALPFYFMQRFLLAVILATACLTVSCGEKPTAIEDFNTRVVTLPNGKKFRCEVMVHPQDMARGMMFRD